MIRLFGVVLIATAFFSIANAQENLSSVALKSGESKVIGRASYFTPPPGCRSLLAALGNIDILQGDPEVALAIRTQSVTPPQCGAKKVDGGVVIATAGNIEHPHSGKLIYRIHYKTFGGADIVWSYRLDVNLEP
jgi:hypothetical protein